MTIEAGKEGQEKVDTQETKVEVPEAPDTKGVELDAQANGFLTQAREQKARADKLEADLSKYVDAEKAAEQKELEAKGEYAKLRQTYEDEKKVLQDKFVELELQSKKDGFNLALAAEGLSNAYTRAGVVQEYMSLDEKNRPEVAKYVESLKKKDMSMFSSDAQKSIKTGSVASGTKTANNKAYTKADLKDATKAKDASAWVSSYVQEHGEFPDGFN